MTLTLSLADPRSTSLGIGGENGGKVNVGHGSIDVDHPC